jgi:hypothetical protein
MYKNNFTALQAFREDVTLPPHALVGNEGDRVLLGLLTQPSVDGSRGGHGNKLN